MVKKNKKPIKRKLHVMVFDHAKVDPSHCLTDGLFRPLKKASYKGLSLDITYLYKDYIFRWVNYCPLSIIDQSVFLAVHKLASEKGRAEVVGTNHENPKCREVREALNLKLDATNANCLVLETTLYEIARVIGYSNSGSNLKTVKESLLRLSNVVFMACRGDNENAPFWKANLFGNMAGVNGEIYLSINPTLSKAIVGESHYTFVSMPEQRDLKSDVAKRMHLWLSSWLKHGETRKIGLDMLIPHIWGDSVSGAALRTRRNSIRTSMLEINALDGWSCLEDSATKNVVITRARLDVVAEITAERVS